jgi:hypothetical protein
VDALLDRVVVLARADARLPGQPATEGKARADAEFRRVLRGVRAHRDVVAAAEAAIADARPDELERRVAGMMRFARETLRLDAKGVTATLAKYPAAILLSAEDDARPVYDALASSRAYGGAGFSKREVARCVVAHPAVLSMSVSREIRPMIEYLIGEVRLRPSQAVDVFKFSLEDDVKVAVAFFGEECGLGTEGARGLIRNHPLDRNNILGRAAVERFRPRLENLLDLTGWSRANLARVMISKYPGVVISCSEENITGKFNFFIEEIGIDKDIVVNTMLRRAPELLTLSVAKNMRAKFEFYTSEDGFGLDHIGAKRLVTECPTIFSHRTKFVKEKFDFLMDELGVDKESAILALMRNPNMLSFSVEEKMRPTVEYVRARCLSWFRNEIARGERPEHDGSPEADAKLAEEANAITAYIFTQASSVMGFHVERKIKPTLDLIEERFPGTKIRVALRLCTFSLHQNLKPRLNILERIGLTHRWAPGTVVRMSVNAFLENTGVSAEEYTKELERCLMEHAALYPEAPIENAPSIGAKMKKAIAGQGIVGKYNRGLGSAEGIQGEIQRKLKRRPRFPNGPGGELPGGDPIPAEYLSLAAKREAKAGKAAGEEKKSAPKKTVAES